MPDMTVIHLLRHGEVSNPHGVLYGRLPGFHLSPDGEHMAKAAAAFLAGRNVTLLIHSRPSSVLASTPLARSSYDATTNPFRAANDRKNSMWQLDSAATNASSGSTPAGSERGTRTTCGDDEARTIAPPSNSHSCARL